MTDGGSAIDAIQEHVRPLIGQRAWGAAVGYGSFVTVEFGRPTATDRGRTHGEWHLWVYCCAWRLEHGERIVAASEDDRAALEEAVRRQDGLVLRSIDVVLPGLDTRFVFDDQLTLHLFGVYSEGPEHWMLFLPDGNVLSVGPGNRWSSARGDVPTPEEAELVMRRCPAVAHAMDAERVRAVLDRFDPMGLADGYRHDAEALVQRLADVRSEDDTRRVVRARFVERFGRAAGRETRYRAVGRALWRVVGEAGGAADDAGTGR